MSTPPLLYFTLFSFSFSLSLYISLPLSLSLSLSHSLSFSFSFSLSLSLSLSLSVSLSLWIHLSMALPRSLYFLIFPFASSVCLACFMPSLCPLFLCWDAAFFPCLQKHAPKYRWSCKNNEAYCILQDFICLSSAYVGSENYLLLTVCLSARFTDWLLPYSSGTSAWTSWMKSAQIFCCLDSAYPGKFSNLWNSLQSAWLFVQTVWRNNPPFVRS